MRIALLGLLLAVAACGGSTTPPQGSGETAPGGERTPKTRALQAGADLIQSNAPLDQAWIYMNGFHPGKDQPSMVMESNHYCVQVNQDFMQCVLFDGNGKDARLHGVEYIVSGALYDKLPTDEKMYWHPHNYEILSGELVMPGLPEAAEKAALADKINSYGKTWHFWKTGVHGEMPDPLPYGPAHLAWSFNRDGELPPEALQSRDARMKTNASEKRRNRADLSSRAKPQGGVDVLAGKSPNAKGAPEGVKDNGDPSARPVVVCGVKPRGTH